MFTRCPECMTVFHISAAELRAADGAVVCGECGVTFDALGTLSETPPTEPPAPPPPAPPTPEPVAPPSPADGEAFAAEAWDDIEPEPGDARDEDDFLEELESLIGREDSAPEDLAPEDGAPLPDEPRERLDGAVEEDWEDHVAADDPETWDDDPAAQDDAAKFEDEDEDDDGPVVVARDDVFGETFGDPFNEPFSEPFGTPFVGAGDETEDGAEGDAESGPAGGRERKRVPALGEESEDLGERDNQRDSERPGERQDEPYGEDLGEDLGDEGAEGEGGDGDDQPESAVAGEQPEELPEFAARQPRTRLGLKLALALGALLCIGAVWAHAQRGTLLRHPAGEAVLGPVYTLLGLEAAPRWSPGEFRALKWEAGADPASPDRLVVAIEFLNAASFAQPYPLLRVVLEDRFGRRVGAHDIEPRAYLEGYSKGRRLPAGGRVRSTVEVPDPGARAEGFRVDFCLESGSDGLVCSTDSAP